METSAAEKFLKQTNLSAITSQLDPLTLVELVSGQPRIQTMLTTIQAQVGTAVQQLLDQQQQRIKEGAADLERLPDWQELTEEERNNVRSRLDDLLIEPTFDLAGLRQLLSRDYDLNTTLSQQKQRLGSRQQSDGGSV